jgi:hypothetical protein
MNSFIISVPLLFGLLVSKLQMYGFEHTLFTVMTIGIYTLLGVLFYISFLSKTKNNNSKSESEEITGKVFENIKDSTSITADKVAGKPHFKENETNKILVRNTLIVGGIISVLTGSAILYNNPSALPSMFKTLLSVLLIFATEAYFSYIILVDYKLSDADNIETKVVDKIKLK